MHSDIISDLLTRIRNASRAGLNTVEARYSNICLALCDILVKEGYVEKAKKGKDANGFENITITLLPNMKDLQLKRISKPGQRIYANANKIPHVLNGLGISIVTTSKGLMTGTEAKAEGLGGEILCEIW